MGYIRHRGNFLSSKTKNPSPPRNVFIAFGIRYHPLRFFHNVESRETRVIASATGRQFCKLVLRSQRKKHLIPISNRIGAIRDRPLSRHTSPDGLYQHLIPYRRKPDNTGRSRHEPYLPPQRIPFLSIGLRCRPVGNNYVRHLRSHRHRDHLHRLCTFTLVHDLFPV